MTTAPERPPGPMAPDALLGQATLASVTNTVLDANPGMTTTMAGRIVSQALAFVATAATAPHHRGMAPSRIVDEGWHALIVHTEAYAELCSRLGRFIHHTPGWSPDLYDPNILEYTQDLIRAAGYDVDAELWRAPHDTGLVSVAAQCQHAPECTIRPMPTPQKP
ncbi:glycine-rich domain-containing protein [Kitasatospora sp. NPDC004289]